MLKITQAEQEIIVKATNERLVALDASTKTFERYTKNWASIKCADKIVAELGSLFNTLHQIDEKENLKTTIKDFLKGNRIYEKIQVYNDLYFFAELVKSHHEKCGELIYETLNDILRNI